jgi:membrane-associated phospholipid phosphatase
MRAINAPAGRSIAFDQAIYDLDHYASLSGVVFMSLVCACWFAEADADKRARILAGALLAFPTGAVSRLLQHVLPTHSRPFYEAAATFRPPAVFNRPYTTWNCFPSDHATVFGALVLVIWMARPRLGLLVTPWFLLVEFSRMYMGEHYPSDILGGFALAGFLICAVQDRRVVALSRRGVAWAEAHPGLFYGAGFFLAYQIATLFFDPRDMVGGLSLAHLR